MNYYHYLTLITFPYLVEQKYGKQKPCTVTKVTQAKLFLFYIDEV